MNVESVFFILIPAVFVCLGDRGRKRQAENWLFTQLHCKHFSICYRENSGQRGRMRQRETESVERTVCEEVAPGHSVNPHQGKGDTQLAP